jgi:uncharacterized RDD family membrane protein YckC
MTNGYPPSGGQPPPEGGQRPEGQSDPGASPPQQPQYPAAPPPGGYPQHPQQQSGYGQPPQTPYGGPSGPRAGFWQRVGAYLLDVVILLIPVFIVLGLLGAFDSEYYDDRGRITGGPLEGGGTLTFQLFVLVLFLAYFTFLEGSHSGQTIGKKALGIRVIKESSGGAIGHGKGLLRNVVRSLPSLLPVVGFVWGLLDPLWMLWDREKQTLHDKVAKTLVVPVAAYPIRGPSDTDQQAYRPQSYGPGGTPPGGPGPNP